MSITTGHLDAHSRFTAFHLSPVRLAAWPICEFLIRLSAGVGQGRQVGSCRRCLCGVESRDLAIASGFERYNSCGTTCMIQTFEWSIKSVSYFVLSYYLDSYSISSLRNPSNPIPRSRQSNSSDSIGIIFNLWVCPIHLSLGCEINFAWKQTTIGRFLTGA